MFKYLSVLVIVVNIVNSTPLGTDYYSTTTEKHEIIPLLKYERYRNHDGSFHFNYEGGDRSFREETGHIENADTDHEVLEVSGSYRYIDADGQEIEVHYTAGKNGFVPVGTNIRPAISAAAKAAAESSSYDEDYEKYHKKY